MTEPDRPLDGPVPCPQVAEILANLLVGQDSHRRLLPDPVAGGVQAALEQVLVRALGRPPCVVSFSGGRDSSVVLALATEIARRHALPPPVPVTMRFRGDTNSDESHWQRQVLDHLRLRGAEVLNLTSELDALGPAATGVLRRHGVRWPGNAFMHSPVLELASGGTLLTGIGGDELFASPPPARDWRGRIGGLLPARAREAHYYRRSSRDEYSWLTLAGADVVRRALAHDEAGYPHRWDRGLHHWYRSRAFAAIDGGIKMLATDHEVDAINLFLVPEVLSELGRAGAARGFATRADGLRYLCRDLLPETVLRRNTKATFGSALWGPETRVFAHQWDGDGLDSRYVRPQRLRSELLATEPDFRTLLLLHQAWVNVHASSVARS